MATFDETSGALTGTPVNADVGNHADIVISVTDGIIATPVALPAFDIAVTNTNDPPTLSGTPATTVAQGAAYSFTPTGEDADATRWYMRSATYRHGPVSAPQPEP